MKTTINLKESMRGIKRLALVILLGILVNSCQNEVQEWKKDSTDMVITEYVYSEPDLFTEFGEIIKATGVENLLRVRGKFTLFLPTDDAMRDYYASKNVSSWTEIDTAELVKLVYNHIFSGEINTANIGLGALPLKNGLGDYVASDFLNDRDILLNKSAVIIKRNIVVSNGYIHHIDHVIDIVTKNVFEVLSDNGGYTIFKEALVLTGLDDTLKVVTFPYGSVDAEAYFTLLAVPDTLYNREGINSVNDLIGKYSNSDDLRDKNNGFYQYMEYHCISNVNYFTDFTPGDKGAVYYIISNENYINIRVEEDFKINKDGDGNYTGFYFGQSNIPAKNGVLHCINSQMPITETSLFEVIFQVTDYFDFKQGEFYGNYYERFFDGQNTFENIKWDAEYLMYYFKNEDLFWDADGLSLSGHFWIEITTPKIRKGKYSIDTYWFGGATLAWFVDDVLVNSVDMTVGSFWNNYTPVGEIEFTETKAHKIRLKTLSPGSLWWDRVKFTPK